MCLHNSVLRLSFSRMFADEDSEMSESEEELLTVRDAVKHIARSARHSRANSSEKLDQQGSSPSTSSRDDAEIRPARASSGRVTFEDAGHISLTSKPLPTVATSKAAPSTREVEDLNGSVTERSESSESWSEERIRQLEEDKAAIERLWGEHAQENDIGVLKFRLVSFALAVHCQMQIHTCCTW